jgi:hypothetical protein
MHIMRLLTVATLLTGLTGLAGAASEPAPSTQPTTRPYPIKTCIVSGETLGEMGKPVVLIYEGRELQFCCKSCVGEFKKDPAKWLKKLDEAAAAKSAESPTTKP